MGGTNSPLGVRPALASTPHFGDWSHHSPHLGSPPPSKPGRHRREGLLWSPPFLVKALVNPHLMRREPEESSTKDPFNASLSLLVFSTFRALTVNLFSLAGEPAKDRLR